MTYTMREALVGSKWTGEYRPAREIAADIRRDLKEAKKNGTIPSDIKISVRCQNYAGGRAVDVTLSGWDKSRIRTENNWNMTTEANAVQRKVESIREAYNRDASDAMVDYWDVDYYGTTQWDYTL